MNRRCVLGALALLLGAVSVPAGEVWVAGPSHKAARNEKPPAASDLFDPATRTIRLHAARNEFVAFQVVFTGPLQGVVVELAEPKGEVPPLPAPVQFFRQHFMSCPVVSQYDGKKRPRDVERLERRYREAGAPREFPEQLPPLAAPFDVAAGRNEAVWADLFVPEGTPPGDYAAVLRAGPAMFPVRLTVWNFTLPSVSHFPQWVYIGPEEIAWAFGLRHTRIPEVQDAFDAYFRMAREHRVVLMEEWGNGETYVRSPSRKYFDCMTGAAFPGPFGKGIGMELIPLPPETAGALTPLLAKQGWLNRAFVYLYDEPNDKNAYDEVRARGATVAKASGGALRRMATEQYEPSRPEWGRLDAAVDIFCSAGTPPEAIPAIEAKGKAVWTYNAGYAGGPYTDAPGPACRTHAWAGFVSGARAWYYWHGGYVVDKQNRWRHKRRDIYRAEDPTPFLTDVWNDPLTFDETLKNEGRYNPAWAIRLNGDGLLFYPGKAVGVAGPVACFRLKNLRQGATDFEYLYLLEKMGRADAALAEARRLLGPQDKSGYPDYEPDGAAWDAARVRLGRILHALGEEAIRNRVVPWNQYPNPVGHPDYYGGKRY